MPSFYLRFTGVPATPAISSVPSLFGQDRCFVSREERLFDREAILGRDTTSVFPTETQSAAQASVESAKAALGAARFVSEQEVELLQSYS